MTTIANAKRVDGFTMAPEDLTIIGFDTPHKQGEHPLWDERALEEPSEEMIRNIMVYGVLETLLVNKNAACIEVVNGRRRTKAARAANKRIVEAGGVPLRVKVSLVRGSEDTLMGTMITTNELRKDDSFYVRAQKCARLHAKLHDKNAVAIAFGVELNTINSYLRFVDLHPEVQEAVREETLSAHAALRLWNLPKDEQVSSLRELLTPAEKPEAVTEFEVEIPDEQPRVTAARVTKKLDEKQGKERDKISIREIRKILAGFDAGEKEFAGLGEETILVLRVMVGAWHPKVVRGLVAALRKVRGE
jgi:ParB-like chromosome segregation protein Spo0J